MKVHNKAELETNEEARNVKTNWRLYRNKSKT